MQLGHADAASCGLDSSRLARIEEHFRSRYLAPGKIPGCLVAIMRGRELGYVFHGGLRDIERQQPMTDDSLFRIYSMSKPITSVALMMLWERGFFTLEDPVTRFIPEWSNLQVRRAGSWPLFATTPLEQPMRIIDLFRHTSGLTYGFLEATNIDHAYRELRIGEPRPGYDLETMIADLAQVPLEFSPGTSWNYSIATDVLGLLVQRMTGQPFDEYLKEHIFRPLEMHDTGFSPREDQIERFASCYTRDSHKQLQLEDDGQASDYRDRTFHSGGGGLISTAGDYLNFCSMLLGGGSFNGHRIISRHTLDLMRGNHLPGGVDLASIAPPGFSETPYEGVGFGLGFANRMDPLRSGSPASTGTYYWGGLASTLFWVDPVEDLSVVFMTQLKPSSIFNFRGQLEPLVYGALQ